MLDITIFYMMIVTEFLEDIKDLFKYQDTGVRKQAHEKVDSKGDNFEEGKLFHYFHTMALVNLGSIVLMLVDGYQVIYAVQYAVLAMDIMIPIAIAILY